LHAAEGASIKPPAFPPYAGWLAEFVAKANAGGIEKVLL